MSVSVKSLRTLLAAALALLTIGATAPTANAAVSVVFVSPHTDLKADGDTIRLQLSNFPTTAGMYVQQCLVTTGRPTSAQCNAASQVWIATDVRAPFKPTDTIAVPVLGAFGDINCQTSKCGLFFRLDHNASTDLSEDRFIEISFASGTTPVLPQDEITTKVDGLALAPNAVGTLAYRTPIKLAITTKSGLSTTIKVYGEGCTASGETITALKGSGQCDIAVTSPGNASYSTVTAHYPVNLTTGEQKFTIKLPRQIVGSQLLLTSKALTNMGEKPKVSLSPSSVCALKSVGTNVTLVAKAKGVCRISLTAPARDGLYNALSANYSVAVKRK